jgi:hypothetical protein
MLTQLPQPDLKALYNPPAGKPVLVEVPEMAFLMVDGAGDPNTVDAYREALEALFSVSYTIKFAVKKSRGFDFHVSPLESLWWSDGGDLLETDKSAWKWTAMMRQPDEVTAEEVAAAIEAAGRKKPLPALSRLRFARFGEGTSAQVMHIGPYSAEGPTIEGLRAFIAASGHEPAGRHHEIYLGDPRRAAPEKLRTIVRQPVRAL